MTRPVTTDHVPEPVLDVSGLRVQYRIKRASKPLVAVDDVSFHIERGETFGLIGESGSGKSTVARAIMRLAPVARGEIVVDGRRLESLGGRALRAARRSMAMVFQDSGDSLDPRMSVGQSIAEPIRLQGDVDNATIDRLVADALNRVGLDSDHAARRPHELSGGQRQRVNIARALTLRPQLLISDEAVSALDLSVQAGILNLLVKLQQDLGFGHLFISHDLAVVGHIADRVGVMYLGQLVEIGQGREVLTAPLHPYAEALLAAEPKALPSTHREAKRVIVRGDIPSPINPPSGCRFRTRCLYAQQRCVDEEPLARPVGGRLVACHFAESLHLRGWDASTDQSIPS